MVNFHKRFPEATDDGDDQYRQPESDGVIQTGTNLIFAMRMADKGVMQIETTFENWDEICKPGQHPEGCHNKPVYCV